MSKEKVVTRFPPSPTGYFHIGRVRTALFNYLFAKHNEGKMIFRIEDTDKERSKKEFEENIIESLKWLNISYDEGPFRQSERNDIYKKYIQILIDKKIAFFSKEKSEEGVENEVIRFKNPNKKITFTDVIRGDVSMDTTDLGDFVIARNIEEPLYHLTVVVDDHEMGVTHVIRGDDGISNTPRQILIQEGIGAKRPVYAHIPLILAADRSKLSSRHGAVAVTEYREKGYLPEAMLNYLALLGWNPGTEQEIFSLDELIKVFSLDKIQKSGAVFDTVKLNWFNKKYIEKMDDKSFREYMKPFLPAGVSHATAMKLTPLLKEKISYFAEIPELINSELSFINDIAEYDKEKLNWKQEKEIIVTKSHLNSVIALLSTIPEKDFTKEKVKNAVWPLAEEKGRGNVLWPMRYALSGKEKSPDPFVISEILGKDETIKRLNAAYEII